MAEQIGPITETKAFEQLGILVLDGSGSMTEQGFSDQPKGEEVNQAVRGLNFPLLSDAGGQVAAQYGALQADRSIQRSAYVVDKAGIVRFAVRGMHWTPEFSEILTSLE